MLERMLKYSVQSNTLKERSQVRKKIHMGTRGRNLSTGYVLHLIKKGLGSMKKGLGSIKYAMGRKSGEQRNYIHAREGLAYGLHPIRFKTDFVQWNML